MHINTLKYGLKITEIMNITWFGQPAGLCILADIKEDKLNFLVTWLINDAATIEQAKLIKIASYDIDLDEPSDTSSKEYQDILEQFNKVYIH